MSLVNAMLRDLDERTVDGQFGSDENNIRSIDQKKKSIVSKPIAIVIFALIVGALLHQFELIELGSVFKTPEISQTTSAEVELVATSNSVEPVEKEVLSETDVRERMLANNFVAKEPELLSEGVRHGGTNNSTTTQAENAATEIADLADTSARSGLYSRSSPNAEQRQNSPQQNSSQRYSSQQLSSGFSQKTDQHERVKQIDPSEQRRQIEKAVNLLLIKADIALSENRLMVPESNNAYEFYKNVLLLDATNQKAFEGLQTIRSRYQYLFDRALERNQFKRAQIFLERISKLGGSTEIISDMANELREAQYPERINLSSNIASKPDIETSGNTRIEARNIEKPKSSRSAIHTGNNNKLSNEDVQESSVFYTRSDMMVSIDQQKQRFKKIDMAINTGNLAEAEQLLQIENKIPQGQFDYLRAKWLVAHERYYDAARLLESRTESGDFALTYYSFLATLYQELQRYDKAIKLYRTLISMEQEFVDAWLGLAISLDAKGERDDALRAYQRAFRLGHNDQAVQQFLAQRISALSS